VVRISSNIKIGVLALQGAFREHIEMVKKCGEEAEEIKLPEQLKKIDGVIIPGGESTTMEKLLLGYDFKEHLDKFRQYGKPIFGTCAGLILIAKRVNGEKFGLGYIDIDVERNAYGRQIDSFEEFINLDGEMIGGSDLYKNKFKAVFIRAPKIEKIGKSVKVLARLNSNVIFAREGNILVSTFHPELTGDSRIHKYFIKIIELNKKKEN
jgi:5'-phosphate synthase pdxT subunit